MAAALSAAWLFIAARQLSLTEFGDLGVILATTTVMVSVTERGVQTAFSIHVAKTQQIDMAAVRDSLLRRIVPTFIGAVINGVLYIGATHDGRLAIPLAAAISLLATSVYGTLLAGYRALGRARLDAANEVISRLTVLIVGTLVVGAGGGVIGAVATYAAVDVGSALAVAGIVAGHHLSRHRAATAPDLSLRATIPLAAIVIVLTVYNRIDTYLVALILGTEPAGLYSAAYRLVDFASVPAIAIGGLVLSVSVRRSASERLALVRRLMIASLALGLPLALLGALAGPDIVSLLFGPRFHTVGVSASILLVSAVPAVAASIVLPIVVADDRRGTFWLAVIILATNTTSNLVLIPWIRLPGAAVANLLSQSALSAGLYAMAVLQHRAGIRNIPTASPEAPT